jgi:DNA polymerase elongation subunit (family B)
MVPKMPLITGWNFLNYDWLYLVNRARKISKWVDGKENKIDPSISSFTRRMNKVWSTNYEVPAHRMIFDYMQLYEVCDTSIKVKESSSLDFVSNKLVGVEKIKYSGSLQALYNDDFETFMYYNAVDSVLVQKIHEARNYISIIFAISELSRIRIVDVVSQMNNALGSLAITEGVLRNRFRDMDNIVLFKDENSERDGGTGIAGGWVKDPVVGMNRWCVTYDFASLYPTVQRQFFIAPETFIGVKPENEDKFCINEGQKIEIDKSNHVVCVNGVVFEKRISPTLNMLEDVYFERKRNKKIMMDKKEELKSVLDEIKKLESDISQ